MATLNYDVKQNKYICSNCGKVVGPADYLCPHCSKALFIPNPDFDKLNLDGWILHITMLIERDSELDFEEMEHLCDFLIKLKGEQKNGEVC